MAVVIPVFNEARWVRACVERIVSTPPPASQGQPLRRSIILVDDASTDGSSAILDDLASREGVIVLRHPHNAGKGAALRTGFAKALELGGDVVLVHDADLEYDPRDHAAILGPILDGRADAVIGSRFIGQTHRVLYFWHSVANRAITLASNVATNLNLTDIECCSKAVRAEVLRQISITENRFGVEPELVAKIARVKVANGAGPARPARVYEVAVSYDGRTYAEGKKIGWKDGVRALVVIAKCALGG